MSSSRTASVGSNPGTTASGRRGKNQLTAEVLQLIEGRREALIASGKPTSMTKDEVAAANGPKRSLIILNGCIFDVTEFLPAHPGGDAALRTNCGRDSTEIFHQIHPESAFAALPELYVGDLRSADGTTAKGRAASRWQRAEAKTVHRGDRLLDVIADAKHRKEEAGDAQTEEEQRLLEQAAEIARRQETEGGAGGDPTLSAHLVMHDADAAQGGSQAAAGGGSASKCPFAALLATEGGEEALTAKLEGRAERPGLTRGDTITSMGLRSDAGSRHSGSGANSLSGSHSRSGTRKCQKRPVYLAKEACYNVSMPQEPHTQAAGPTRGGVSDSGATCGTRKRRQWTSPCGARMPTWWAASGKDWSMPKGSRGSGWPFMTRLHACLNPRP